MSLKDSKLAVRSAAWQISLWETVVFAIGTTVVFLFLQRFVADDIQRRSDTLLSGHIEVLAEEADRTPKDAFHGRVLGEVAELESKEVLDGIQSPSGSNDSVFFMQIGENGSLRLWVGTGTAEITLKAIQESRIVPNLPSDMQVNGFAIPFRVVSTRLEDGSRIYLGISQRDELRAVKILRIRFFFLWLSVVLLGFANVFFMTRRILRFVRKITETASQICHSDLKARVPTTRRKDEIAHLALALNHMLDRIENSMHQLHTITDSLAHDLRSPLTAIRGRLEISLSVDKHGELIESVVFAIRELDRLTDYLNQSLDISEAKADALRLTRTEIDLNELLRSMIDVYGPSMADKGLQIGLHCDGPVTIEGDVALIHRMIGNLIDNEINHLPADCTVTVRIQKGDELASLTVEDNGPGFAPEVRLHLFERGVKGSESGGSGLGLAFVDAVARAHGGSATACNREQGGVRITVTLPLAADRQINSSAPAVRVPATISS